MSNSNFSGLEVNKIVVANSDAKLFPQSVTEGFQDRFICINDAGYGDPTGTTGDVNILKTNNNTFEYHIKGTQTIVAPTFSAPGLNITMDQTDNDGVEVTNGIDADQRVAFTIGEDQFFGECTITIADVSGTDDCAFGFRTAESYQANIDDYNNMAVLNVISGTVTLETILNNGATSSTSTGVTVADGVSVTLRIEVLTDGSCTYFVNGNEVLATNAFKFDTTDVVVPFIFFLHSTDVAGNVVVTDYVVAPLEQPTVTN